MLQSDDLTKIELQDAMMVAYETKLKTLLDTGRISILDYDRFDQAHITITLRSEKGV